jgi:hypothetical protein
MPIINPALDASGNGNNWTPININYFTSGVTYDTMTDVPTNTNATTANYATWNPLARRSSSTSGNTVVDGNLKCVANNVSVDTFFYGTVLQETGKWYWEATVDAIGGYVRIGVDSLLSQNDVFTDQVLYLSDGTKTVGGTNTSYGATYTTNDVIGVALDNTAGTVTFYKNNTSQGAISLPTTVARTAFVRSWSSGAVSINFGQRGFLYTPPSGFVALNTFNLPTPTIGATASTQAINYTGATTYSGDSTSNRVITTGGGSQFVWIKRRNSTTNHILFDVLRGAGDTLYSNLTSAAVANGGFYVQQFGTTGFTLGTGGDAADNITGGTYVAWNWNAGGTTVTNTAGSISAQVRANPTAGFSIVTYTGTGTNATVGHGLGVAPSWVIVKVRNASGESWGMYHVGLTSAANAVYLNLTQGQESAATQWNSTAPTSSVFSIGTNARVNGNTNTFVAYCFAAVAGYSSFGRYTGTGSSDGAFVYTGFRPRYVMFMRTDTTGGAAMVDSSRDPFNVAGQMLYAYGSDAEGTNPYCDLVSNGFKVRGTSLFMNASGGTYIYMAFAETPFNYANAR